jgi:hypothetical protein
MKISTQSVPGFSSTPFTRLALGVGFGAIAIAITSVVLPQPASAQSAASLRSPSNVTSQQSEQDGIGQSGDFLNVNDLIHSAQLGTGELTDPNQSITDAVAKFQLERQRQLGIPQPLGSEQLAKPESQLINSPAGQ